MKLYDYAIAPNPRRVNIFLAEKEIEVPVEEIDLRQKQNVGADFLAINALGFDPEDLPTLFAAPALDVTHWGTAKVDWNSMMTNLDGVFAGGDIVRGASLVVWAIKDGRDAAAAIHRYIGARAVPLAQAI